MLSVCVECVCCVWCVSPFTIRCIGPDSCTKTRVIFNQVVSTFEAVNCKSITVVVQENCPSINIDKTHGCQIILNEQSVKAPPNIVTSNTSALNVVIPGKKPQDDPVTLPQRMQHKQYHSL